MGPQFNGSLLRHRPPSGVVASDDMAPRTESADHTPILSAEGKLQLLGRISAWLRAHRRGGQIETMLKFLVEAEIKGEPAVTGQQSVEEAFPEEKRGSLNLPRLYGRARRYLCDYFAEATSEPVLLVIPSNTPWVTYVQNEHATTLDNVPTLVSSFWRPHTNSAGIRLIYSRSIFIRTAFSKFTRDVTINCPEDVPDGAEYAYSHVPAGEVQGVITLARWFHSQGDSPEVSDCRRGSYYHDMIRSAPSQSFIVFGSARSNGFVRTLQDVEKFDITVKDTNIVVATPTGPEKPTYEENQDNDAVYGYVVVTRLRRGSTWITLFHGNHSQAMYRLAQVLTDEEQLKEVYENIPSFAKAVPDRFQLLFEVEIDRRGETDPQRVLYITGRF